MRLLDPFAGLQLASGHPIFHACLFICSYIPEMYDSDKAVSPTIEEAFMMLRWTHLVLFIITTLAIFSKIDSDVPLVINEKEENVEGKEETEKENHVQGISAERLNDHRDSRWKLLARSCDTLSAFFYQGVIFHVQIACYKEHDWIPLTPPRSAEIAWIWIEMYCFYIYIFATVRFIAFH